MDVVRKLIAVGVEKATFHRRLSAKCGGWVRQYIFWCLCQTGVLLLNICPISEGEPNWLTLKFAQRSILFRSPHIVVVLSSPSAHYGPLPSPLGALGSSPLTCPASPYSVTGGHFRAQSCQLSTPSPLLMPM
jgi:hypothetical protein